MPADSGRFLIAVSLGLAAAVVAWKLRPASERRETSGREFSMQPGSRERSISRVAPEFAPGITLRRLLEERDQAPRPEDWRELTRILFLSPEGEMLDEVESRFAGHAGEAELLDLELACQAPPSPAARQRILEVFSRMESPAGLEFARRTLADTTRALDDAQLVACARSLAAHGGPSDVRAILRLLDTATDDATAADGLAGLIGNLREPAWEPLLLETAAGRGEALSTVARAAAARALRNYPSIPVTELLHALATGGNDPLLCRRAAESLEFIRAPE